MTAFLASLVERAKLFAPVLERRQRSLFEPTELPPLAPRHAARGGDAAALFEHHDDIPSRLSEVAMPPPSPPPQANPAPRPRTERSEFPAAPAAAPRPIEEGSPAVRSVQPPALSPIAPQPPERLFRMAAVGSKAAPRPDLLPDPAQRQPLHLPAVPPPAAEPIRPTRSRQPALEPVAVQPLPRASSIDVRPPASRPPPPASGDVAPPVARAAMPRSATVAAPPALLARARAVAPIHAAPPPSAPPVQITIGRVEIQAHPAAAESRRPSRPAAPRLSLDDYLDRRSGAAQ